METNVKSVFLMCRAVVRRMLEQPACESGMRGSILNMASALAFSPSRSFSPRTLTPQARARSSV